MAGQQIVLTIDCVSQKEFSVPQDGSNFIENALHSGQIPKRLVIAFVGNNTYVGSYTGNLLNLAHFNVQKVLLFRMLDHNRMILVVGKLWMNIGV